MCACECVSVPITRVEYFYSYSYYVVQFTGMELRGRGTNGAFALFNGVRNRLDELILRFGTLDVYILLLM